MPDGQLYKGILSKLVQDTYSPYPTYALGQQETLSDTGLLVEEFDDHFTIRSGLTTKERLKRMPFVSRTLESTCIAHVFIKGNEIEIRTRLRNKIMVFYLAWLALTTFMMVISIADEGNIFFVFILLMQLSMLRGTRKEARKFTQFVKELFTP